MITGGFGLFFEPGGRPRGRRTTSIVAPSNSVVVVVVVVGVVPCCLGFLEGGGVEVEGVGVGAGLSDLSDEVWDCWWCGGFGLEEGSRLK